MGFTRTVNVELDVAEAADSATKQIFDHYVQKILEDLDDVDTPEQGGRKFSIHYEFITHKGGRTTLGITASRLTLPKPLIGAETNLNFDHGEGGEIAFFEEQQQQIEMPDNVTNLKRGDSDGGE